MSCRNYLTFGPRVQSVALWLWWIRLVNCFLIAMLTLWSAGTPRWLGGDGGLLQALRLFLVAFVRIEDTVRAAQRSVSNIALDRTVPLSVALHLI